MAWEEFDRNGIKGISGDKPIDELAIALKKITTAYEDRFSRKPTIAEILYALETVIGSHPTRYVSDSEGLRFGSIIIQRDLEKERNYIDTTQYEGVYSERTMPGCYLVLRKNLNENSTSKNEVIKIPTLEVRNHTLICEYEILNDDITDKIAETLILMALLRDYMENFYKEEADKIEFKNLKSEYIWTIPYI